MEKICFVFTTLPWPVDERARALMMGEDFWSYEGQGNTREIEAITRYAHEHARTARRLTAEDLFVASTFAPWTKRDDQHAPDAAQHRSDRAAQRRWPLARPQDLQGGGGKTRAACPPARLPCVTPVPPPHLSRVDRCRRPPRRREGAGGIRAGQRSAFGLQSRVEIASPCSLARAAATCAARRCIATTLYLR